VLILIGFPVLSAFSDTPMSAIGVIVIWSLLIAGMLLAILIGIRRLQDIGLKRWLLVLALVVSVPFVYIAWPALLLAPPKKFKY